MGRERGLREGSVRGTCRDISSEPLRLHRDRDLLLIELTRAVDLLLLLRAPRPVQSLLGSGVTDGRMWCIAVLLVSMSHVLGMLHFEVPHLVLQVSDDLVGALLVRQLLLQFSGQVVDLQDLSVGPLLLFLQLDVRLHLLLPHDMLVYLVQ